MSDGQSCGVLGLNYGRVEGFRRAWMGLSVFYGMQVFFSLFLNLLSFMVWGSQGF